MSQPFIGEIRMFAGDFAPLGWAFCHGQLLPIAENDVLFTLIGTTYGGDGQETFALPDLRGRAPMHVGNGHTLGELGGVEEVTLTVPQIPSHTHAVEIAPRASDEKAASRSPARQVLARPRRAEIFGDAVNLVEMKAGSVTGEPANAGGSQPHSNLQPFLAVHFIISLFGIYPSRS